MRHAVRVAADFCRHKIGYRGAFLLFLVFLDLLYGWAMVDNQLSDHPITVLTWHEWGIAWIAVGLFLLTGVFSKVDRAQYTAAIAFKAFWVAALIQDEMINHVKGGGIDAIIWAGVVAVIFLISSWPEPIHRRGP